MLPIWSACGQAKGAAGYQEDAMQLIMTTLSVIAGMVFSLGISLLVEELIFGKVFPLLFAPAMAVRIRSERQ